MNDNTDQSVSGIIVIGEQFRQPFSDALSESSKDYKLDIGKPLFGTPFDDFEHIQTLKARIEILEARLLALGGSIE